MTGQREDAIEADVVVLGSGAAGLFAAVEAAEAGASTVVVESEHQVGGSTRLSGGYVALCETELEPGSRDELLEDLDISHRHDTDVALSRVYVDHAGETHDRLVALGLRFARTKQFAYMRRPWAHELPTGGPGGGAQIVAALEAAARGRGVVVRTGTRAVAFHQHGGRVVGVDTDRAGTMLLCRARRGVVVATGGFTRRPELVRAFGPRGADRIVPISGPGSRGDGLRMFLEAGAAVSDLSVGIAPTAPVEPESGVGHLPLYSGGVTLNLRGRRFCDESASYLDICWAALEQPNALIIQVYDARIRADYQRSMLGQVMHGGRTFEVPSLTELFDRVSAEHPGLDVQRALETMQRYNDGVDQGSDAEFGRRHLLGDAGERVRVEDPPVVASVTAPGTTHFNGGVTVDPRMRVLRWDGTHIQGLYAAGEVTGGFHGAGYLSGSFVGMALIFGRLAGLSAARATAETGQEEP